RGAAGRNRRRRGARLALRSRAAAPAPERIHRHDDAGDDRRRDRHAERRAPRLGRRREVDPASVSDRAARAGPGRDSPAAPLRPRAALPAFRTLRAPRTHRMTRTGGWLLVAGALALPLWLPSPYHLHVAIMAGIFGVRAMSLNLLLGYTGQLSLGHAAFFGIGAYTSALLTLKLDWSFWPALAAAVALAGAAGLFIGRLALKLRGAYFVLVTISFAGVVSLVSI